MKLGSSFLVLALVTLSACSAGTQQLGSTDADGGVDAGKGGDGTDRAPSGFDDGPADTSPPTDHKRIFMTSTTYTGDLGGVEGADAKCALVADGANLGGTWKAWISSSTVNAIDRIDDVGPWYLVGGTNKVFNNKSNLGTTPLNLVSQDENGRKLEFAYTTACGGGSTFLALAWSGTDHGEWTGFPVCEDWTSSSTGSLSQGGALSHEWEACVVSPCSTKLHLICLEQ